MRTTKKIKFRNKHKKTYLKRKKYLNYWSFSISNKKDLKVSSNDVIKISISKKPEIEFKLKNITLVLSNRQIYLSNKNKPATLLRKMENFLI